MARGRELLLAMKELRALDANRDGVIDAAEFERLLSQEVLDLAWARVALRSKVCTCVFARICL